MSTWDQQPDFVTLASTAILLAIDVPADLSKQFPLSLLTKFVQSPLVNTVNADGNTIIMLGQISFDNLKTSLAQSMDDLLYDVAQGGSHVFRIYNDTLDEDVDEYIFSSTEADFKLNNIINVTQLSFLDTSTSISQQGTPNDLVVFDAAVDYEYRFRIAGDNLFRFSEGGFNLTEHNLTNVARLSFGQIGTSIQRIDGNLVYKVPSTFAHVFDIITTPEYIFDADQADFLTNNLVNITKLEFLNTDTSIEQNGDDMRLDVDTDGEFTFRVANGNLIRINATLGLNLIGSNIINTGTLSFTDTDTALQQFNDNLQLRVADGQSIILLVDGANEYFFDATQADFLGKPLINVDFFESNATNVAIDGTIRLGNNQTIEWRNFNNNNEDNIRFSSSDAFVIEINSVDQYAFSQTEADFTNNNLVMSGGFLDMAEITTPATPGTDVGRIFMADNTFGVTKPFLKDDTGLVTDVIGRPLAATAFYINSQADLEAIFPDRIIDINATIFFDSSFTFNDGIKIKPGLRVEFISEVIGVTIKWNGVGSLYSNFATTATATANIVSMEVDTITVTDSGAGYVETPLVTIAGGGATLDATATAVLVNTGGVTRSDVNTEGSGYNAGATIMFSGGGGSGATGNVNVVGGMVKSIKITNSGTGYLTAPFAVILPNFGGSGASSTPFITGDTVASITVDTPGSGYTSNPAVIIDPPAEVSIIDVQFRTVAFQGDDTNQLYDLDVTLACRHLNVAVSNFESLGVIKSGQFGGATIRDSIITNYKQGFLFVDNGITIPRNTIFQQLPTFTSGNATAVKIFNDPNISVALKNDDLTVVNFEPTNPRGAGFFLQPDANTASRFTVVNNTIFPLPETFLFQQDPDVPVINAVSANGGASTKFVVNRAHGLSVGDQITQSEFSVTEYNGVFTVTDAGVLDYTVVVAFNGADTGILQNIPIEIDSVANGGEGFAEFTTASAHGLRINDIVVLKDFTGETSYNGTFIVTQVDTPVTGVTFDVEVIFVTNDTGTLSTKSLDSTDPKVTAKDNPGFKNSMSVADGRSNSGITIVVNNGGGSGVFNPIQNSPTVPNDFIQDPSTERFRVNTNFGRIVYLGLDPITVSYSYQLDVEQESGNAQALTISVFINTIEQPKTNIEFTTPSALIFSTLANAGFLDLVTGDTIQLYLKNDTNTIDTDVENLRLLLSTV